MHRKHSIIYLLLAFVLGLFLSLGCRSEASLAESFAKKKHLLIGNGSEFGRLDPQRAFNSSERRIQMALFEPLVKIGEDLAVIPALAKSWTVNDEHTVYTFYLREEAKWSDGVAITADDCVCAFQHLLSPQIANSVVWFAYAIKGAEAYNHGKLESFEGVGVKALDKHVFEVTLNQPSYHFLNLMTYMAFAPIPAHQVLKSGGWSAPHNNWDYPADIVSSGPFRIFKHIPNEALVLEKNPHYWNAQSVDLQGITFLPIGNALTEEQAFLNDQLHITYALPINRLPYYEKYGSEYLYVQRKYAATELFLINTRQFPFSEPAFRRALNIGIDRNRLCQLYTDERSPATGFIPEGTPGYESPTGLLDFDPEGARALFGSVFPNKTAMPKISLSYSSSIDYKPLAEALQQEWLHTLGLSVSIEPTDAKTHWAKLINGSFDLARLVWRVECMDPWAILGFFASNCLSNPTGWKHPAFDEALNQAAVAEDPDVRNQWLQKAETLLMQEGPVIPLFYQPHAFLIKPYVKGFSIKGASWIDYTAIYYQ